MTTADLTELRAMRAELLEEIATVAHKVDAIETRLDRWDGAITLIRATAGILGIGGIGLILAAIGAVPK